MLLAATKISLFTHRRYAAPMSVTTRAGIVCQWCDRIIQGGGEGLTLVTCIRCSRTFGSATNNSRRPATANSPR